MKVKAVNIIYSSCSTTCLWHDVSWVMAQPVPAWDENIPYLMTFGKDGKNPSWGDDDFSQTFFFKILRLY
ncbi:MAG: hypothetical protein R2744_07635 [Bacteroidales bacterium]